MAYTPSTGLNAVASSSSSGSPPLPGMSWSIELDPKAKDVSNFATGRVKVPTLLDGTLKFKLLWDSSNKPVSGGSSPVGYFAGAYITVYCFQDKANGLYNTFSGLISRITQGVDSIEDAVTYDVTVSLSAIPTANTFTQLPQFVYNS